MHAIIIRVLPIAKSSFVSIARLAGASLTKVRSILRVGWGARKGKVTGMVVKAMSKGTSAKAVVKNGRYAFKVLFPFTHTFLRNGRNVRRSFKVIGRAFLQASKRKKLIMAGALSLEAYGIYSVASALGRSLLHSEDETNAFEDINSTNDVEGALGLDESLTDDLWMPTFNTSQNSIVESSASSDLGPESGDKVIRRRSGKRVPRSKENSVYDFGSRQFNEDVDRSVKLSILRKLFGSQYSNLELIAMWQILQTLENEDNYE